MGRKELCDNIIHAMEREFTVRDMVQDTTTKLGASTRSPLPLINPEPHAPSSLPFKTDTRVATVVEFLCHNQATKSGEEMVAGHLKEPGETNRTTLKHNIAEAIKRERRAGRLRDVGLGKRVRHTCGVIRRGLVVGGTDGRILRLGRQWSFEGGHDFRQPHRLHRRNVWKGDVFLGRATFWQQVGHDQGNCSERRTPG